jgi:cell division transport system permease protein
MQRARYVLSEVLTGLWRNVTMTVAMIITMAVSLTMLGAALLLYLQVDSMKTYFYAKIEVSIFLKEDVTADQRNSLNADLRSDPLVDKVIYESREDAYANFKHQFASAPDLVDSIQPNSLPESFRVKLKNPEQFKAISDRYKGRAGIDDIVDQRELLGRVFSILGSMQNLALIVAIVQGVAALLLVANTIQVAAYSKRREVAVMKLVGASNWFIQSPFVLEAVFAGLIGAILGFLTLVAAKVFIIDGSLKALASLLTPVPWHNVVVMLPLLAGVGAVVSAVTAWVTLRFYVRV